MIDALGKFRGTVDPNSGLENPSVPDAVFLGWQESPAGEVFALYNVTTMGHPLYHSTVSEKTLHQHGLEIPPIPHVEEQGKWSYI
jgi:hypothetical protein